ncbi:sporulation related protein [Rhodobacter sp. JA431]|uniref:SPOR domain-containing protein n=1 Tax=Rhodobacter sp. JA431 TaxID=570013 RepID=UPI000BC4B0CA|nr:SPOR domain-containing protein [Rhodobacter sp. JA431]SOB92642.1 sporulation related protein [Rhodobacter sp. JA431]
MRRYGQFLAATALVALVSAGSAVAEMRTYSPAEVPPPSFKGRQYVDSSGCVFVRAGYGTAVRWVPRVSRDKKQLCGYQPTFQNGEAVLDVANVAPATPPAAEPPAATPAPVKPVAVAAATPTAAPKPAPAASQATVAPPAPAERSRAVSPFSPTPFVGRPMATIATTETPPQVGRVAAATPAPAVQTAASEPRVAAASPTRSGYVSPYVAGASGTAVRYHNPVALPGAASVEVAAASAATIMGTEQVDPATTSCPAGTVSAQRYTLSDGRRVVRCGAQVQNPAAFINQAEVPGLVVTPAAASQSGYVSPYVSNAVGSRRSVPIVDVPLRDATGYVAPSTPARAPGPASTQASYAAVSPYQSAGVSSASNPLVPEAVLVRTPATGQVTLAPVIVSTKTGPGYKPAFEDGRLNPFRGPRSLWGDAQQSMIWTNQVPAKLVTAQTPAWRRIVPTEATVTRVSTKSAPVAARPAVAQRVAASQAQVQQPTQGPRYVQVGTFAVASNVAGVKARLAAAGLPVASSTTSRGLTIVYAGPFADARAALGQVRGAGFSDVILR